MDKYAFFLFTTNFMPERAFLLLMEETSSILFKIEQECMCVGFEPLMRSHTNEENVGKTNILRKDLCYNINHHKSLLIIYIY